MGKKITADIIKKAKAYVNDHTDDSVNDNARNMVMSDVQLRQASANAEDDNFNTPEIDNLVATLLGIQYINSLSESKYDLSPASFEILEINAEDINNAIEQIKNSPDLDSASNEIYDDDDMDVINTDKVPEQIVLNEGIFENQNIIIDNSDDVVYTRKNSVAVPEKQDVTKIPNNVRSAKACIEKFNQGNETNYYTFAKNEFNDINERIKTDKLPQNKNAKYDDNEALFGEEDHVTDIKNNKRDLYLGLYAKLRHDHENRKGFVKILGNLFTHIGEYFLLNKLEKRLEKYDYFKPALDKFYDNMERNFDYENNEYNLDNSVSKDNDRLSLDSDKTFQKEFATEKSQDLTSFRENENNISLDKSIDDKSIDVIEINKN